MPRRRGNQISANAAGVSHFWETPGGKRLTDHTGVYADVVLP